MEASRLGSLVATCYEEVEKGILSAFVERWHRETSSFHLPVGEMTITLDDVSSLLHLPILGGFWSHPGSEREISYRLLRDLIGVLCEGIVTETDRCHGARD